MPYIKKSALFVSGSFFFAAQAFAGAPNFIDSRAMAMGGVGVASARPAAAGFFNPALLAVKQPEKRDGFGMLLPSVNAIASDEAELRDVVDDFDDDFIKPFEGAITDVENNIAG
ncbi:conjugal transfer protein TraF, partial [Oleiphilus sp. HI0125]